MEVPIRWVAPLVVALLWSAASVAAEDEDGRKERWKRRRLEKLEALEPQTISKTERILLRVEQELGEPVPSTTMGRIEESLQLVNENLGDLPYPEYRNRLFARIGSIRSGGGLSGGGRYVDIGVFHPEIDFDGTAAFSLNGYQFYRVRFGNMLPLMAPTALLGPMLPREFDAWFAYADVRYHDFREETLFGLGAGSEESDAHFRHQRTGYSGIFGYRLSRSVIASARVGFAENRIGSVEGGEPGEPDERRGEFPGLGATVRTATDFVEMATSLQVDFRDVPGNPRRGAFAGLSLARFDDIDTDAFRFTRVAVEAQGFVPLGSPQRNLAIRGQLSSDQAAAGQSVPFYLQRTLGGNETLRGFDDYRFRGENLMHLSVEYRWNPAVYWGLSLFWDTGKVFRSFDDGFDLNGLENSFGIGTRLQTPQSTLVRLQVARSREGTRFHFAVGMAF